MIYLFIVTAIWSFSFSLIGVYLSGQVDSWFAVVSRICLALLVFIPFLRFRFFTLKQIILLAGVGAFNLELCMYFITKPLLI